MRLTTLSLEEFRGFRRVRLAIPAAGLRVSGRNGSGKTSLLEAVYLIATMRSPRAASERELINWRSGEEYGVPPYARVRASVALDDDQVDVEVALGIDEARGGAARKRVKVDGVPRRAIDAVGMLKVVLFSPEDLNLVLGPPSVRRRYLDVSLAQVDRAYLHSLSLYARIVQQRNSLLKELGARGVRDERRIDEELAYWDEELVLHGSYLVTARLRYLAGLAEAAREAFDRLASDDLPLDLRYLLTVALPEAQVARAIEAPVADAQALVSRAYEAELARARPDELRRGVTLLGPHRDDFDFLVHGRRLSAYGSRGQQRLAVVATKLAELRQVVALAGERPVLLLDDVLSELDAEHRERLIDALGEAGCQVIITATDRHLLEHPALAGLPEIEVVAGAILGDAVVAQGADG